MRALIAAAAAVALSACAQAPSDNPPVYIGYLRQGFEQSDFYPGEGADGGPWWVTVEESEQAKLDALARGEGRGRAVVVQIIATGEEKGPVDFGFRPKFVNSLHVTRIIDAQAVSDETMQAVMERAQTR